MEIVSASTFVINIITAAQLEDCYLPPSLSLLIVIHHQLDQHLHLLQIEYNQPTDRYLTIYYYTPQFHVNLQRSRPGILIFWEETISNDPGCPTSVTTEINVMASIIRPHIALYFQTLGQSVSPGVCKYQNMNSF